MRWFMERTMLTNFPNKTSGQILVRIWPDVGSVGRPILHPIRVRLRAYCYPGSDVRTMTESGPISGPNRSRFGRPILPTNRVRIGPDVHRFRRPIIHPNRVRLRAYCYPASDVRI